MIEANLLPLLHGKHFTKNIRANDTNRYLCHIIANFFNLCCCKKFYTSYAKSLSAIKRAGKSNAA